ncbi:TIGR02588 family protein [Alkalinema pantanalense CENA528]|uniref:TIGR02588 family protein n=1 Tax=Alkalinema pantanalense TaxID=1620705 RepID=UPI003D700F07
MKSNQNFQFGSERGDKPSQGNTALEQEPASPDSTQSDSTQSDSTQSPHQSQQPQRTPIEWLSFGISLTIVSGLIALVGVLWLKPNTQKPPNPVVSLDWEKMQERSGQFHVPFKVTNEGDQTATQVQLVGEIQRNGQTQEVGTQEIDFLSRKEVEEGVFVIPENPQQSNFKIRVTNYQLP